MKKLVNMNMKTKHPKIEFYCKTCKSLGRQKDFIMPVKDINDIKGVSMACINCLKDKGYQFKEFR